jgi:Domain of unknown function (DUF1707)
MSDPSPERAAVAVRASDAEREQTVTLLQRNFAEGRLSQAELEERVGAAYAARTRAELSALSADLPADPLADHPAAQPRPSRRLVPWDQRLFIIVLIVHPPAGLVYWLLTRIRTSGGPARALTPPAP